LTKIGFSYDIEQLQQLSWIDRFFIKTSLEGRNQYPKTPYKVNYSTSMVKIVFAASQKIMDASTLNITEDLYYGTCTIWAWSPHCQRLTKDVISTWGTTVLIQQYHLFYLSIYSYNMPFVTDQRHAQSRSGRKWRYRGRYMVLGDDGCTQYPQVGLW